MPKSDDKAENVPQPLIGSFVLESLTTGMYGERRNAIREYVQNSFDSIQTAVRQKALTKGQGKVVLTIDREENSLRIRDNGLGLPRRVAIDILTAIGASRKERSKEAGFRGIGRLAGIAFTTELVFRTKAPGETLETAVTFHCERLRKEMLDNSKKPAAELISECTTWTQTPASSAEPHYFEVYLRGLTSPPAEAVDSLQLKIFLSQVAPVDFDKEFPYRKIILEKLAEEAHKVDAEDILDRAPLHHLAVYVGNSPTEEPEPIFKPYGKTYAASRADSVSISDVSVHVGSGTKAWWGWIGHKKHPGAYTDPAVAGIRFRMRNIQIDGTDLIKQVPIENTLRTDFERRSDLFLGEIHIDPVAVVPNARRDGFEDDNEWLQIRSEISRICRDLTKEAHEVSEEHQLSLTVIEKKAEKYRKSFQSITRAKTADRSKVSKLIADADKLQKDIERARPGSDAHVVVRLKAIAKDLTKIKSALLTRPETAEFEQFRQSIKDEFLETTLSVLDKFLDLKLYEEIKQELLKNIK